MRVHDLFPTWSHFLLENLFARDVRERQIGLYNLTRGQVEDRLAALSHDIWRERGVEVPAPDRRGSSLRSAGSFLMRASWPFFIVALFLPESPSAAIKAVRNFSHFHSIGDKQIYWAVHSIFLLSFFGVFGLLGGLWMRERGLYLLRRRPQRMLQAAISSETGSRGRRVRIWAWITLGLAIAVPITVLLSLIVSRPSLAPWMGAIWIGGGFVFFPAASLVLFYFLYRRSSALLQPTAKDALDSDPRRPIIFLRSFADDDLMIVTVKSLLPTADWITTKGFEEAIGDQFSSYGPLIAIGKPGEALPQIGAARAYSSDKDWQQTVLKWMDSARILLLVPGRTEGLRWELDAIRQHGHVSKLLIVMPPSTKGLSRFVSGIYPVRGSVTEAQLERWRILRSALNELGGFSELPERPPANLICLCLAHDGQPIYFTGPETEQYFEEAISYAIFSMLGRPAISGKFGTARINPPSPDAGTRASPARGTPP